MSKVAVVGGGAAGMMAAVSAAQEGKTVVLYEKNEKLGKKLYGKGTLQCYQCLRDGGAVCGRGKQSPIFIQRFLWV